MRKKKYIIGYVFAILLLSVFYFFSPADANTSTRAIFARADLPPGTIIQEGDLEYIEGFVPKGEQSALIQVTDPNSLIGKKVSAFGIRKDRPVLQSDLSDLDEDLHELKLIGDITIPEEAKVVSIIMIFDQRTNPNKEPKILASNVPVKEVYNAQNIPLNKSEVKGNKVPKTISVLVTERQRNEILKYENRGVLRFTTVQ